MSRWTSIVGTAVIVGLWAPSPLLAQDAVKDLLNRAQSQSEKRAVEELIDKLKSPGAAKPPPAVSGQPPAASVAPAPAAAPAPPAVARGTPPAAAPGKQETATPPPVVLPPAVQPPATAAAPVPSPAPTVTPGSSQPAPASPAVAAPAIAPAASPSVRDLVTAPAPASSQSPPAATPVSAPPSAPRVAPFASNADAAKAPEMAEKLKLPTADIEVYFEFDSAQVTPKAVATLAPLGQALADARLAGQTFIIAGHTDGKGRADYNLALSQRRAEAVRQYVIDTFGLDPANLIARGFGEQRLKNARNPFAEENRRVQIINWTSQTAGDRPR